MYDLLTKYILLMMVSQILAFQIANSVLVILYSLCSYLFFKKHHVADIHVIL